jgi:hypothetical protein
MIVIITLIVIPISENTGCDAILLGAETQRGLYPVEAISMVCKICAEVCFLIKQATLFFIPILLVLTLLQNHMPQHFLIHKYGNRRRSSNIHQTKWAVLFVGLSNLIFYKITEVSLWNSCTYLDII